MSQALREHRRRLAERGMRRVEVAASASDAELIRRVARALISNDKTSESLRTAIQGTIPSKPPIKFKDWLASLDDAR